MITHGFTRPCRIYKHKKPRSPKGSKHAALPFTAVLNGREIMEGSKNNNHRSSAKSDGGANALKDGDVEFLSARTMDDILKESLKLAEETGALIDLVDFIDTDQTLQNFGNETNVRAKDDHCTSSKTDSGLADEVDRKPSAESKSTSQNNSDDDRKPSSAKSPSIKKVTHDRDSYTCHKSHPAGKKTGERDKVINSSKVKNVWLALVDVFEYGVMAGFVCGEIKMAIFRGHHYNDSQLTARSLESAILEATNTLDPLHVKKTMIKFMLSLHYLRQVCKADRRIKTYNDLRIRIKGCSTSYNGFSPETYGYENEMSRKYEATMMFLKYYRLFFPSISNL